MLAKRTFAALCFSLLLSFSICIDTEAFPLANQPLVGEVGNAVAGDGAGNFLVGIEMDRVPDETNGPVGAVLFASDGTIVKTIETGRVGCCPTGATFDGNNYLLVWEDGNGHAELQLQYQQVYGLFIDAGGNPVGSAFAVGSAGIQMESTNALAFNGTRSLAVYTKLIDPSKGESLNNRYIAGSIINPDGSMGPEFRISSGYGQRATVATDGEDFFVVWIEDLGDKELWGRHVDADGTPGAEVLINASARSCDKPPSVRFGTDAYLVAFNDKRVDKGWDVLGQLVGPDGGLIGSPVKINAGGSQAVPTIGFDGEKFLVAYNDMTYDISNPEICDSTEGTCWDIRGRYVSAEGTLIGNPFAISAGSGMEFGGVGGHDAAAGFLTITNQCGKKLFGSKCDVFADFISPGRSYLGILSPKAGEVLRAGALYPVTWTASPDMVRFSLKVSTDNGKSWSLVNSNLTGELGYDWITPTVAGNSPQCLLKLSGYDAGDTVVTGDKTDGTFAIEVARLTSPNGGESLKAGGTHDITWMTNATQNLVVKVVLSYTQNGGVTWQRLDTIDGGNPGTYSWAVPAVATAKLTCKVKVVLKDSAGNTVGSDLSDAFFTIQPPMQQ